MDSKRENERRRSCEGAYKHDEASSITRLLALGLPVEIQKQLDPTDSGLFIPLSEPVYKSVQTSSIASGVSHVLEGDSDDEFQKLRVKYLRLVQRLGQNSSNGVFAQVFYRLGLGEELKRRTSLSRTGALSSLNFEFERETQIAEKQEAAGQDLDFTCTIIALGKSGVGKSATINSIFDERKSSTDAFRLGTEMVKVITGTVEGIKISIIDTPGLVASFAGQRQNKRILGLMKLFMEKTPPDIVLDFDRLDMQSTDHYSELLLLRTITQTFSPAIWLNTIIVFTHAASPLMPDGPNGDPLNYDMFVAERSNVMQQDIREAAGDMELYNAVCLAENYSGPRVLPNGHRWKAELLLICFSCKILAEAKSLLKFQERPVARRPEILPLPYLLSTLLKSRVLPKIPEMVLVRPNTLAIQFSMRDLFLPPLYSLDHPHRYIYHPTCVTLRNYSRRPRYFPLPNPWEVVPIITFHEWEDVDLNGVRAEKMFVIGSKIPVSVYAQSIKDKKKSFLRLRCDTALKLGGAKSLLGGLDIHIVDKEQSYTLRTETMFDSFHNNKTTLGLAVTVLGNAMAAGLNLDDILKIGKRFKLRGKAGAFTGAKDAEYGATVKATLGNKNCTSNMGLSFMDKIKCSMELTFMDKIQGVGSIMNNSFLDKIKIRGTGSVMDRSRDLHTRFRLKSKLPIGDDTTISALAILNNVVFGKIKIWTRTSGDLEVSLIEIMGILLPLLVKLDKSVFN